MKGCLEGMFKVGIRVVFSAAIPLIVASSVLGNAFTLGFFNLSLTDSVPFLPLWKIILDLVNPIFLIFMLWFASIFVLPYLLLLLPILAGALYLLTIIQKKTGYNTFACFIYSFFTLLSLSYVYCILAHQYYHLSWLTEITEIHFSNAWVFLGSLWGAAYFSAVYKLPYKLMIWSKIFIFFMASIWLDTIILWYGVFVTKVGN